MLIERGLTEDPRERGTESSIKVCGWAGVQLLAIFFVFGVEQDSREFNR